MNPPTKPEAAPIFDAAQFELLLELQDETDKGAIASIVELFLESAGESFVELAGALERGETEPVARIAHSLKGNSGTMGMARLSGIADRMERLALAGDLREVAALLDPARATFHESVPAVEDALANRRR